MKAAGATGGAKEVEGVRLAVTVVETAGWGAALEGQGKRAGRRC